MHLYVPFVLHDLTRDQAVRSRYLSVTQPPPVSPLGAAQAATGYVDRQPPSGATEQVLNILDRGGDLPLIRAPDIALGPFIVPQPPPLTGPEIIDCKPAVPPSICTR